MSAKHQKLSLDPIPSLEHSNSAVLLLEIFPKPCEPDNVKANKNKSVFCFVFLRRSYSLQCKL